MIKDDWDYYSRVDVMYDLETEQVSFPIFSASNLDDYCANNLQEFRKEIERMEENYVLNVNETEYIEYLTKKYTIDVPFIDFENATISYGEENVFTEPSLIITFNLPLSGDYRFLLYSPGQPDDCKYTAYVLLERDLSWITREEKNEQDPLLP